MGKTKVGMGSKSMGKVTKPKVMGGKSLKVVGGFKAAGTDKKDMKK